MEVKESISGLGAVNAQPKTESDVAEALGQEDFLELLVAQMNNQNPLEPQSNGEFLAQMAQFGTVDGIQGLQDSFDDFSKSMQSNDIMQASSLIGHKAYFPQSATSFSGQPIEGSVDINQYVTDLKVSYYNKSGEVVHQQDYGNHTPGQIDFSWDGVNASGNPVEHGNYTIKVEGSVAGNLQSFSPLIANQISSVQLSEQGIKVNVENIGKLGLSELTKIK